MDQIDTQRVADITRRFLESNGTTAIANWKPTDLDDLEAALRDTILREYPKIGTDVVFQIATAMRVASDSPLQITVNILRPVGRVEVAV
jgi:hypothetical protein